MVREEFGGEEVCGVRVDPSGLLIPREGQRRI